MVGKDRLVTVFGGSGFVGRHVVRALARQGWRVRVASRRPDLAFHLQPSGRVGQINAVQANLRYPASIASALRGADAVVNLVGLLRQSGRQTFETVHRGAARALARAAREAGIADLVHISALGADLQSPSIYARTKAEAELAIRELIPGAIILRPSLVFGPEDGFFNRFAAMARLMPALPLIGGGKTKFQPVFVGDVGLAVAAALDGKASAGTTYELGGPDIKTMRELLEFILKVTERKRLLLPIPFAVASLLGGATEIAEALAFGFFPSVLSMTRDQMTLLKRDSIVSPEAIAEHRTLQGLGITPEAFETIVPTYLYRYRKTGQFADQRAA